MLISANFCQMPFDSLKTSVLFVASDIGGATWASASIGFLINSIFDLILPVYFFKIMTAKICFLN